MMHAKNLNADTDAKGIFWETLEITSLLNGTSI